MHPLLRRQFEELENTKTRRLFPPLIGTYNKPLEEDTGILGVNRRGGRYALIFKKDVGFDFARNLSESGEYRVMEVGRSFLGSRAMNKMRHTKPIGATREFHIYDPKAVDKLQSAIDAHANFIQRFRLLLNERQFDFRLFSKNPRHSEKAAALKVEIAELKQKIQKNEKSKASLERQLASVKPLLKVLVKGHIVSFKGDWRKPLSILDDVLHL